MSSLLQSSHRWIQPRILGRCFSSSSRNGKNGASSPPNVQSNDTPKRSKPVVIKKTPRSFAKAKRQKPTATSTHTTEEASAQSIHLFDGGIPTDPRPPPFTLAQFGEESLYTLILLRHGESEWNLQNRYTGWCDVPLTKRGEIEARTAGRLLYENGIEIDLAFTSVLKRASFSCNMALNMAKQHWVPVTKTWRLNERHYGALQGYNKDDAYRELGLDQELVMQMRRAYDVRPPFMQDDHPYWHGHDRRYHKLSSEQIERSRTESLKDAADRIMPFFNSVVVPSMRAGNKCLIVAHANTIRTLTKHIDGISDEDIKGMTIPTGIPLLYRLDKDMVPVDPQVELEFRYMVEPKGYTWGTSRQHGFHGVYLGDLERLQDIQRKRDVTNRDWQRIILYNVGKSLGWDMDAPDPHIIGVDEPEAIECRQLWWQVHHKMQQTDYSNMLLLLHMEEELERLIHSRHQRYLTKANFISLIEKLHLDAEGKVVEPFVALADRQECDERRREWEMILESELEEEALIK